VTVPALRRLLEICFQLQDEGVAAAYEKVTTRLEDAGLKNLAADIDCHARLIGMTAETAQHTLKFFRDRRELREKAAAMLAGPYSGLVDAGGQPVAGQTEGAGEPAPAGVRMEQNDVDARERLRKSMDLHRKRASRTTLK